MPANKSTVEPFAIKDCALIALATGRRARDLRELHDRLLTIEPGSIYYHFWGGLLRPGFDHTEHYNDFARWAHHALHDGKLAERLSVIDPSEFSDLEELRERLIEVIEERLDEGESLTWAIPDQEFQFITSQIVVFDTRQRLDDPTSLADALPSMSLGSIFYHFVDARRRTPEATDDVRTWLCRFGQTYADLCDELAAVNPYFSTLSELRTGLTALFRGYFGGTA